MLVGALLGLAGLAAPRPAGASLGANPSSSACERTEVENALAKIRAAGDELQQVLGIIQRSPQHCVITPITSGQQRRDDTAAGSEIFWNPDPDQQRYQSGLCIDPVAALAHELWHCYAQALGNGPRDRHTPIATHRTGSPSIPGRLPKSEVEAVNFENAYRTGAGHDRLCRRTTYDAFDLPEGTPTCPPPNLRQRCPRAPTACTPVLCCCWIYGGIKDPKSGGWGACTIDRLTPDECHAYTRPNLESAGCYATPCSFPDNPPCP